MSEPASLPQSNRPAWPWLLPAFVALVVLAPLFRGGLPVTQLGLLSEGILLPLNLPHALYKPTLMLLLVANAIAFGALSARLWRGHGAWIAALLLTLPLSLSLVYQWGDPIRLLAWFLLLACLLLLAAGTDRPGTRRRSALVLAGLIAAVGLAFLVSGPYLALDPYRLLVSAWPDPRQTFEWVGAPSFRLGVVPAALGAVLLPTALSRRDRPEARRALGLLALAASLLLLAFLPGPALLWLVLGASALLLAVGALPLLDPRYAALPVQLAVVALSVAAVYPALEPAWFDDLRGEPRHSVFGEGSVWLARVDTHKSGGTVTVEAWWQPLRPLQNDYSAFVHVLDEQNELITQADALLVDDENRPASAWPPGYVVYQKYEAAVSAPVHEIRLGLYDAATLERLPLYENAGFFPSAYTPDTRHPNNYITLTLAP